MFAFIENYVLILVLCAQQYVRTVTFTTLGIIMSSCGQIYINILLFSLIFHVQQNSIFKVIRQSLHQSVNVKVKMLSQFFTTVLSQVKIWDGTSRLFVGVEWVKTVV